MPLKIVVWNIQNFTYNKIAVNPDVFSPIVDVNGNVTQNIPYGSLRADYILDNPMVAQADIFVVIEVISTRGKKGSLVPSESVGGQGLIKLLKLLQINDSNWWNLVPPARMVDKIVIEQISGGISIKKEGQYTEAVGVFYRSDRLDFIGPYVWPQTADNDNPDKTAVPQNNMNPVITTDYPAPWNSVLPAGNHYAGQFEYKIGGNEIHFNGADCRRPFTTQFRERGANPRIITLASVHYPPQRNGGHNQNATTALSNTMRYFSAPNYAIAANEVVLIAGDFNLKSYPVIDQDYIIQSIAIYGYNAVFKGANAQPSMYKERYAATTASYINPLGLDNVVYRAGAGIAQPLAITGTMMNRVIDQLVPPSDSLMTNSLATLQAMPDGNQFFRLPQNYMKLGPAPGTSDHMAMYISF